jgi:CHASE2 domain-containing sensor protein
VEKGVKQELAKPTTDLQLDELLKLCTVKLSVPGKFGWGTGFFVAPGKILTCAHVVKDAGGQLVKVCWQGKEDFGEASVQGLFADPFDLALLELQNSPAAHPCVYLDEALRSNSTVEPDDDLYIYGYPDDTPNGAPVTAKCEGLTGDKPPIIKYKQGQVRPGISGSPLLNRRTCKVAGIVKFTRDRSNDLGGGAVPVTAILEKFSELKDLQAKFHKIDRRWNALLPKTRCRPRTVALTSLGIATAIGIVRFLGLLQGTELKVYDHFMQTRPNPELDDRIKIVVVEVDDVKAQEQRGEELIGSLSHKTLNDLLNALSSYSPRVIGLDFYRPDRERLKENPELLNHFKSRPNLIGVCKVGDLQYQVSGVAPPPEMPNNRVGFSDFIVDNDGVLRRQVLAFAPPDNSPCLTPLSFNLQVARQYLAKEGFSSNNPVAGGSCQNLAFTKDEERITFPNLRPYTGGYQYQENATEGCQILLNYRASQDEYVNAFFSLSDVLSGEVKPEDFRDKIVLIGAYNREFSQDYWNTPFGIDPKQMPGVVVQAQMISQILSVVKGDRALIWVMPQWAEWFWILGWSVAGGFLGRGLRSPRNLGIAIIAAGTSIYIICLVTFQFNGWLPLVPPLLGLSTASVVVWWIDLQNSASFRSHHKQLKPNSTSV